MSKEMVNTMSRVLFFVGLATTNVGFFYKIWEAASTGWGLFGQVMTAAFIVVVVSTYGFVLTDE